MICLHALLNDNNLQKNVLKSFFEENKESLNRVFFGVRCCANEFEYTPLHIAALTQDKKNIKLILKTVKQTGMLKHFVNNTGRTGGRITALHIAVNNDRKDIVKLLLKNGADRNIKDESGRIPLEMAVSDEMTRILLL